MDKYVWIGHREAEIFKTNNFFSYSITSYAIIELVKREVPLWQLSTQKNNLIQ